MRPGIALAGALALVLAACGGPSPSTPEGSTPAASASTLPTEAAPSAPPTEVTPTEVPATETPPAPEGSLGPSESLTPAVDSLKVRRTADCLATNGTSTVGSVKLTWASSGATGVRISIDPPSADVAYDYGYGDYPASGSAEVPFACDPPNHDANGDYHLYVVTTLKVGGWTAWRYARVYQVASPSPTP